MRNKLASRVSSGPYSPQMTNQFPNEASPDEATLMRLHKWPLASLDSHAESEWAETKRAEASGDQQQFQVWSWRPFWVEHLRIPQTYHRIGVFTWTAVPVNYLLFSFSSSFRSSIGWWSIFRFEYSFLSLPVPGYYFCFDSGSFKEMDLLADVNVTDVIVCGVFLLTLLCRHHFPQQLLTVA